LVGIDSQILKNININNNLIQSNQIGIKTIDSAFGIKISDNTIINNVKYEIQNTDENSLDARFNWWGSNAGPLRSKISGNVNYYPWVKYSDIPVSSISKILKKNQDKKNNN
jgi:nitrous oxidase accessory protein NosD